jgi:putative peptidoglycan lipid II flippase
MMPDSSPDMSRGAVIMAWGVLVSRFLGFARDLLAAHLLGAGADVFLVAFRVPNFLRRLLSEGSLGLAPAAAFSGVAAREGLRAAEAFARRLWMAALLASAPLVLLLMAGSWPLAAILAPGFAARPDAVERAAFLLRLCLLYLPLCMACAVGWSARACMGDLRPQAYGSAVFNIAVIAGGLVALFFFRASVPGMELGLCMGVASGGLLQMFCFGSAPGTAMVDKRGYSPEEDGDKDATHPLRGMFRDVRIRAALGKMPVLAFGAAAHQFHALAGTILASFLAAGSISSLYFAERLVELPLGLAGVAVGMAALPRLTFLARRREFGAFADAVGDGLSMSAFVSFPAAVGLVCLADPVVRLLFGHGAYGPGELAVTARCLAAYAPGLPAMCAARTLLSATMSLDAPGGNPALSASLRSLGISVATGACLMPLAGVAGIAFGGTVGAWCNAWFLWRSLRGRGVVCPARGVFRCLAGYAAAALVMGAALLGGGLLWPVSDQGQTALALSLAGVIGGCALVWCLGWHAAGNRDIRALARALLEKHNG